MKGKFGRERPEWWRQGKGKFRHFGLMAISMKVFVPIVSTFQNPHILRACQVKPM